MPPEAAEVRRWLTKADNDVRAAQAALSLTPAITDVAAFHCQQAVEKMLKGYLVWQGREFEKIHDLRALANLCTERDPTFADLREQIAPLTPFAVRFRYPGPADPTVDQVRSALATAEVARAFILARIPADMHP